MKAIALSAAVLLLAACAQTPAARPVTEPAATNIIFSSYSAADRLVQDPRGMDYEKPILVASLVDVNHLEHSSALGRMIAEQMAARFATTGYTVVELKLRDAFLIQEGRGEFILSRDVRAISQAQGAQAVVAGTYAVGAKKVYVNVRLIRASDSRVVAAYDYIIPIDEDVLTLLGIRYRDVG
jgi:TolB-like protein